MNTAGILRSAVAGLAVSVMALLPMTGAVMVLSADAAYANNGNGNGNGGGNGNGNGGGRGNANGNDKRSVNAGNAQRGGPTTPPGRRGDLASALGAMNAAHANQRALENASPNSMPGRLHIYQQTGGINAQQISQYMAAQQTYMQLSQLTQAQILAAYDADADGILRPTEQTQHQNDLAAAQGTINTYSDAYSALARLAPNGQMSLTSEALDELNALLGL